MLRAGIFVAASVGIVALSRRSLAHPRHHGFYRFFGFELLAALILLNVPVWFQTPWSPRQLASWTLLAASLALALEGFRLLRTIGKPARRAESRNLALEDTTTLVRVGAYRYIRHPLYASLLALTWGACLKNPAAPAVGLAIGASAFFCATAMVEERENLAAFGAQYAEYMRETSRFVPFVF